MKTILRIFVLLLSVASLQGCQNETYAEPTEECVSPSLVKNKEVSDIFTATAAGSTNQYLADDVIEAVVTSSDEGGNFFKSLSLMSLDGTRGFSISIDEYNLYTKKLQPGRKVYVKMKNLYTSNPTGGARGLNFGGIPSGTFNTLERLLALDYGKFVIPTCTVINEDTYVKNLTLAQLNNDLYLNTLVEIDNVQFESEGTTYGNRPSDAFDKNENITDGVTSFVTRTSKFANFAGSPLPSGRGKIRGILTKFNSTYQLIIRTERDVKLTNSRVDFNPPIVGNAQTFVATLNEPFTSYTVDQFNFPKYINDVVVNSKYWKIKSFGANQYIETSSFGFSGTSVTARTLFFVPVDFTAANTFTFKKAARFYQGPVLKVYYVSSANYTPGSIANISNFTEITSNFTITYPSIGASENAFTSSGIYNIPASLTGTGYFVFEYSGTPTVTTTMQIDDIVIN
jgi:Family of unknown function (DUF5689)